MDFQINDIRADPSLLKEPETCLPDIYSHVKFIYKNSKGYKIVKGLVYFYASRNCFFIKDEPLGFYVSQSYSLRTLRDRIEETTLRDDMENST